MSCLIVFGDVKGNFISVYLRSICTGSQETCCGGTKDRQDLDDVTIEIESDNSDPSAKLRSITSDKKLSASEKTKDLSFVDDYDASDGNRYHGMQHIPGGTFIMGTDEQITKDGEGPARK